MPRQKPGAKPVEEVKVEEVEKVDPINEPEPEPQVGETGETEQYAEGPYMFICNPTQHNFQPIMLGMEKQQGGRLEVYEQGLFCTNCGVGIPYVQQDLGGGEEIPEPSPDQVQ